MTKTQHRYLKDILEKVQKSNSSQSLFEVKFVFFNLTHYLNVRNHQIANLEYLKENGYITFRLHEPKKAVVSLTEKGINYLTIKI